jgi:hypothetical protein
MRNSDFETQTATHHDRRIDMRIALFTLALVFAVSLTAIAEEPKLESIFNGKDLSGWTAKNADCWSVKDGILQLHNDAKKKGDILRTEKSYKDFIVQVEFKFQSGRIDSGVFIRNTKEQIQIGESGSLKRDMTASPYIPGKGYPVEAAGVKELLKMEDWNTLKIRAVGNKYTTWLNGKEVMNYESASAAKEGPIGIQLHPGREMKMQYRNIVAAEIK